MQTGFIQVLTEDQISLTESMAKEIWTKHYAPIIGQGQVDYMLARFQSRKAISDQIKSGVLYFLIESNGEMIGYMAVLPQDDSMFLSKIYLRSASRARGHGRKAVHFVECLARQKGLAKISLTVNKKNTVAIRAYERLGFRNVGPVVQDIGGGFFMDDYKMEKIFSAPPLTEGCSEKEEG